MRNPFMQQVASRVNKACNAEARRAVSAEGLLREVDDKNKALKKQVATAKTALADMAQCLEETLLKLDAKTDQHEALGQMLSVVRSHAKMYRDERNLERKEVDRLKKVVGRLEGERDQALGQVRWYERKNPLSAAGTRQARDEFTQKIWKDEMSLAENAVRDPYTGQPLTVENMGGPTVLPLPVTIEPPPGLKVTWGTPLPVELKAGDTLKLRMEISPAIGG